LRRFRFTLAGAALGLSLYFLALFGDTDLFERFVDGLKGAERLELDELLLSLLVVGAGVLVDVLLHLHQSSVQRHKEEIFDEAMRATQHIVNNFLNNLQYIRMEVEENGPNAETHELFDRIVNEASEHLKALGDLERAEAASIRKFYQLDR